MTSSSRLALVFPLALAVVALAPARALAQAHPPTAQELETARALYKEGKELRAQGNLRGALEKLQAAHALGNTPVTGIELARTYVMVTKLVEAREVSLYIARIPVAGDETEKSVEARTEAAKLAEELRPRIPTLKVIIHGLQAREMPHLAIDGASVPDAALGQLQKVDPGRHAISLHVGDGAAVREANAEIEVVEGEAGEVTLTVPPPAAAAVAPPPAPAPAPARVSPTSDLLTKLGFGIAVTGGVVGSLTGLIAMNKKAQLATACNVKNCSPQYGGTADLDAARAWANVSTVAFAIGGAGLVVGIIGLATGKSEPVHRDGASLSPWIGVGAAGLHGRF